jgi:predicted DCC family thiol-disulfide oxidoreductase YuxK
MKHWIILFDGPCTLCNKSVQWIFKHDRHDRFRFTPLQGQWADAHLAQELKTIDAVVLFDGERFYTKSTAILMIVGQLWWPWRILSVGWLIPKFIRDFMYVRCASRRYLMFGTGYCALVPGDRLIP